MRLFIVALSLIISSVSFAETRNVCARYSQERYIKAITAVAKNLGLSYDQLCALPRVWDVEAQPSHTYTRDGERIPHVRIQLHGEYESCLYMVRDADLVITENRCYSGF